MKWMWMVFVAGAMLSWGCYVPMLHEGQKLLGGGKPGNGSWRAFLCVGLAYFVTAVIIPGILLMARMEETTVSMDGVKFATIAGTLGAAGALCIIFAIKFMGPNDGPRWIPPLVFAGAPIINTIVSLTWHPPKQAPGTFFYLGIVLAAVGAGMVLFEKARLEKAAPKGETTAKSIPTSVTGAT